MSKEEVISYFISNGNSFNVKKTLIMLCIGLVVGLFIYATYYICCDKTVYNKKFNGTILVTLLITELIMMMISSNIAVSLGMVGALSIVRFRTALKDSRDTIFLFWAIAEGLCVGTESYKMVIVSVMFISVVFIVLSKTASLSNKYLIVINGLQQDIDIEEINNVLNDFVIKKMLRTVNGSKNCREIIYEVKTKGELNPKVIEGLMELKGIDSVNFVIEMGEIQG